MNLYVGIYGFGLIKDIRQMFKQYLLSKNLEGSIPYLSKLLGKIQLSVEIAMNLLMQDKEVCWKYKRIIITIIEILITFFKFREYQLLYSKDIKFYLSSDIYFSEVLMSNEENFNKKLLESKDENTKLSHSNTLLTLQNDKSTHLFNNTNPNLNISIPQKILSFIKSDTNLRNKIISTNINSNSITNIDHSINNSKKERLGLLLFILKLIREKDSMKEVLYLVKPLIYLLSLLKFNRDSSIPFIINIVFDYIIRTEKTSKLEGTFTQKYLFNLEQLRRSGKYMIYLLRNPVLYYITKPFIVKLLSFLRFSDSLIISITEFMENIYLHYLIN